MTRRSWRELENDIEDLERVPEGESVPELGDPAVITRRNGEWVGTRTGEPVDVDENTIIVDFENVDT